MRYTRYTVSIATSKLIPGLPSTHPREAEAQRVTTAAACMMVCVPGPVPPVSHRTIKHRGINILIVEQGTARLYTCMKESMGSRKSMLGGLRVPRGCGCVRGSHLSQEYCRQI